MASKIFRRMARFMNTDKIIPIVFLVFVFFVNGCKSGIKHTGDSVPVTNEDYFQEIGQAIGLNFVHSIGGPELNNIIESSCGGTAFLDYDQDGFIDIFATSGTWLEKFSKSEKPDVLPSSHLFRNNGDGTFEDVSKKSGIIGPWYTLGVSVADFDNDGYPDLYLSNFGSNVLLRNKGNGTFVNITDKAKVAGAHTCSVGAVWLDYDNDSFLDLYVGNYLEFDPEYNYFYAPDGFPPPMAYEFEPDVLYHNNGDGTFEDVTTKMGIVDIDGRSMGVGAADIDDDGFVDIFVANDHTLNYLWHNEGGKHFTEIGTKSGTAFSQAGEATVSMSVDFADYNSDGLMDLFVSDDTYCSLYENQGNGIFTDKAMPAGISSQAAQFVGWSSSFIDYDNNGVVDIFKTNGALKHLYGHEDQLFMNDGKGKFRDISNELGEYFHQEFVGRGTCIGDYDNDGDMDVFIVNLNDHGKFLRNNKGNQNNWIMLDLQGSASNRDAIGARVMVLAGGASQKSQKRSTVGYLSQNDPRMHFGLAKNTIVDKIEIKWPSGKVQVLENVNANQIIEINEP
jgi:hypothetical protein